MTFIRCVEWVWSRLMVYLSAMVSVVTTFRGQLRWIPVTGALGLSVVAGTVNAATWHVIGTGGNDGNLGNSWGQGLLTIQEALTRAAVNDQIWVKEGTYVLDSTTDTYLLEDGAWLLGGFAGTETERTDADPYANPTILSGNLSGGGHAGVVATAIDTTDGDIFTRLDGFTITGGGTGLRVEGDLVADTIELIVSRCTFEGNAAGAASVVRTGTFQATSLEVSFINCVFQENTTDGNGAAVFIHKNSTVWLHNCLVVGNTAEGNGGGIYLELTCEDVRECDKAHCQTNFSKAFLNNCTFHANHAEGYGGAVYVSRGEDALATGCIFWENTDDLSGSTDLEGQQISTEISRANSACDFVADHSCIQGLSAYANTGNIANNPDFVNPTGNPPDFHVDDGSPCIDAGDIGSDFPNDTLNFDNDSSTTEEVVPLDVTDLRILAAAVDMGPYEKQLFVVTTCDADCVTSGTFAPPPDGTVDAADNAFLLGAWGPCPPPCCPDTVTSITFAPPPDGVVDAADLAILLGAWGDCPESFMGGGSGYPYEGTEIGDLLDQLLEEDDEETIAALIEQLLELLGE